MARTRVLAILAGLVLCIGVAPAALARSNVGGSCGSDANGYLQVTFEEWWQLTVDYGFEGDEALAVEVLAPLFGVDATVEAVEGIITAGLDATWDKNDNDLICWKDLPNTPGNPTYVFIVKDDAAAG